MVFHISHLAGTKLDAHLGSMELILSCSMSLSWLGKLSISARTEWKYMVTLSMILSLVGCLLHFWLGQ